MAVPLIGWSLYKHDGEWHEAEVPQADISDAKLALDIEAEGDTVAVMATSTDGVRYTGDYRYRDGSYSNGEVSFDRYKGPAGDVFVGERREVGPAKELWIIKVETARARTHK